MFPSLSRNLLAAIIRDTILSGIEKGSFHPGNKLPAERQFAESLGVSRGALREAIRTLEAEGRVTRRHGVGVEIADNPTKPFCQTLKGLLPEEMHRLRQSAEARLIIDPELAALAAIHGPADESARLADEVKCLDRASPPIEAIEADIRFHHARRHAQAHSKSS